MLAIIYSDHAPAQNPAAETGRGGRVWPRHPRPALKRPFGYLRDRLFLAGCVAYASNRWLLKPHLHNEFLHSYFNDTLLISCALPPVLLAQRWSQLRSHDEVPRAGEIIFHVIVWSILFEWIGPHIMPHTTGDPWDAVAYGAGGLAAGVWWQRDRWRSPRATA